MALHRVVTISVFAIAFLLPILAAHTTPAQQFTNEAELLRLADHFKSEVERRQTPLFYQVLNSTDPAVKALNESPDIQLMYIDDNGMPVYYIINNVNAARTVNTYNAWPVGTSGLNLTGAGTQHHEFSVWDGGGVLVIHQEFQGRVVQADSPSSTNFHATHVAGTMAAGGVNPSAKGMSYEANMNAYDWDFDEAEMAGAAAAGLQVSSHSYGPAGGWHYSSPNWYWFGEPSVSEVEDYAFGFYTTASAGWDQMAYNAPYYLICQAAGNDRDDTGPGPNGGHYVWDGGDWVWSTTTRDPDGGTDGYDCITGRQGAKNILTVGAVNDIVGGYTQPSDVVITSFSSAGPMDDGRIKPDIVANGTALFSTSNADTNAYLTLSGTSMSTPNASGSINLLVGHYENIHGTQPRSATMKGIVLHSADEAGPADGPDYLFGWGLLNTVKAAELIEDGYIIETSLLDGLVHEYEFTVDTPKTVRITMSWVDIPGTALPAALNPRQARLVNDLDIQVELLDSAVVYEPWVLDVLNPSNPATTGDNNVDNVEQIYIANAAPGTYRITVDHDGSLSHGSPWFTDEQAYTIICTDSLSFEPSRHHYVSSTGSNTSPYASPATAAHKVEDAVGVAEEGDTVHVATETFTYVTLDIARGIVLEGAWDTTFVTRDVDDGKSVLDLMFNLTVQSPSPVVIDGFVIQNGSATYGGGVEIQSTETTLRNCEITQNEATNASVGYGGGVYAIHSTVYVEDCEISSNNAMQGGGIYLDDCAGSISGSLITGNGLLYGTLTPSGAGVCLSNCTAFAMSDNVITGNLANVQFTSQGRGGGICLFSSGLTLNGDSLTYNEAGMTGSGGSGGAVHVEGSDIQMTGVTISRNKAKTFGGGINADAPSTVSMTGSRLMWNSAIIGGGVYMGSGTTILNHNLIVGNVGTACYVMAPTAGSIIGNTIDRNSGSSGGAFFISSTSIPLFNNIITNSTGDAIRCSGATTPTPEYNNVWNNSGSDYVGCTPGVGSIAGDPVFVDTAAVDYHLGLHSVSIDAGNPDPMYDDPDGSRGDQGWYGSHAVIMQQPEYPQGLSVALDDGDAVLNWTPNPETDLEYYGVYKDTSATFVPTPDNFIQLVASQDSTFNAGPYVDGTHYKI
ncbi:MAG: S8 family serine peptidase, partial [Candidatus Latescibacterota bacterium]